MQTLYLVRGLPGSGKTTLAHRIAQIVHEADDYFMVDGEYRYDAGRIREAHNQCQERVALSLAAGYKHVAVANTFTRRWEMASYYQMSPAGRKPLVVEVAVNVMASSEELAARCVHSVPVSIIAAMRERWEA
jgi:ABC-type glutathione transport system ATPase component